MSLADRVLDGVRPRIEGEREAEILDATVALLLEVGYDRLTMDAVAKHARASKATLYRRWESKSSLVVDAVARSKSTGDGVAPDTGTLRGDLLAVFCGTTGMGGHDSLRLIGQVVPALLGDPEFAETFRHRFIAHKVAMMVTIYQQAAARGELLPGADPALLGPALAGILLHRTVLLGEHIDPPLVARVLDEIILPAATGRHAAPEETP